MPTDLNTASLQELLKLPGIGPAIGQRIVDARPFKTLSGLQKINGIGTKRYLALVSDCLVSIDAVKEEKEEKIPSVKLSPAKSPSRTKERRLVNLNDASVEELRRLKGVGPALAQRIVEARPFRRKDEITSINGIGSITYEKLQHQLEDIRIASSASASSSHTSSEEENEVDEEKEESPIPTAPSPSCCIDIPSRNLLKGIRSSVLPALPSKLLIASWNIRNLSKKRDAALLHRIIEIMSEFDLVALQEVRDTIVLKRLKNQMPGWDYIASPLVGSESNSQLKKRAEHFVFFYRRSAVAPVGCGMLDIPPGETRPSYAVVRPPYIATFQTMDPGVPSMQITLVNVHVVCGDQDSRQQEIEELRQLTSRLQSQRPILPTNDKILLLGDFNLAPQDIGCIGSGTNQYEPLILSPLSTTVASRLYDNIWMNTSGGWGKLHMESGVQRIDWAYYPVSRGISRRYETPMTRLQTQTARVQCTYEVSDHCPVFLALGADTDTVQV